jgi:uncharacterized membrane protein
MKKVLTLFCIALPIGAVIDLLWIGVVADSFYRSQLGDLFAPTIVWQAAALFYVFYILAIIGFAVIPALKERSLKKALLLGAGLGFTAYMTYDLTNLAVIRDWPLLMSVIDIVWGTLLTAGISVATTYVALRIKL